MTYRYYSTQRPLTPGSCPRAGVQEVVNYDEKKFCEEIGMDAWGFVEYTRELTKQEADDYELTPAGLKKFWCVTTAFHDDGKVVSASTDVCEAAVKPENVCKETKTKDIYLDWFDTEEEAKERVKEALNA